MDKHTVRGPDGSIDFSASGNKYLAALREYADKNEVDTALIVDAMDYVFDESPSKDPEKLTRLTIGNLASRVSIALKVDPSLHNMVELRVRAIVKNQPRFHSLKGKGGGVARLARAGEPIPALPEKTKKSA